MDIGFETIGNAILILYDRGKSVLVTDPWFSDQAYFGSWGQSHEIPDEQLKAIREAEYVWISHGHPDHLNADSMPEMLGKKILLPDHVGNRIRDDLIQQGYDVRVMKDREWYPLTDRIRIYCISDMNQDGVLLADVNGRLVFNRTDASDHGWENHVRGIVKRYPISFLMGLSSRYGDADMINYYDEDGLRIPPRENVPALGARNAHRAETIGARYFVPFSSMHTYQREDSVWASPYHTSLEDYGKGFHSNSSELLPAYVRYDCGTDQWEAIDPAPRPTVVYPATKFGDDWDERLTGADFELARAYFQSIAHLGTFLDYVNLRVGGRDNAIAVSDRGYNRGVTFEAPRNSLMTAIQYEVFDDLLIANFMKTTLHGDWGPSRLYPDFTPFVAKYSDNGRARSEEELDAYFKAYRQRAVLDFIKYQLERKAEKIYRRYMADDGVAHRLLKRGYWYYKKVLR